MKLLDHLPEPVLISQRDFSVSCRVIRMPGESCDPADHKKLKPIQDAAILTHVFMSVLDEAYEATKSYILRVDFLRCQLANPRNNEILKEAHQACLSLSNDEGDWECPSICNHPTDSNLVRLCAVDRSRLPRPVRHIRYKSYENARKASLKWRLQYDEADFAVLTIKDPPSIEIYDAKSYLEWSHPEFTLMDLMVYTPDPLGFERRKKEQRQRREGGKRAGVEKRQSQQRWQTLATKKYKEYKKGSREQRARWVCAWLEKEHGIKISPTNFRKYPEYFPK